MNTAPNGSIPAINILKKKNQFSTSYRILLDHPISIAHLLVKILTSK